MKEIIKNYGKKIYTQEGLVGCNLNRLECIRLMTKLKIKIDYTLFENDIGPNMFIFNFLKDEIYLIEDRSDDPDSGNDLDLVCCSYSLRFFNNIFEALNSKIKYYYILDKKLKSYKYSDILNYLIDSGCEIRFGGITYNDLFELKDELYIT